MQLIPTRKSRSQRAMRTVGKAGRTALKLRMVQRAPKAAAAVWVGRRSGTILRATSLTILGLAIARAIRDRTSGKAAKSSAGDGGESYRTTPTPQSSQQTGAAGTGPAPGGPTATEVAKHETVAESSTPPHGDPLEPGGLEQGRTP
jgi:hypothetical protein